METPLRIGTRGSPLALAQTKMFIDALAAIDPAWAKRVEVVPITTSGDLSQARNAPLCENAGGKAQFALEIEDALLDGRIDCAVHSMKDLPPVQPDGLKIAALLPRGDARDVFISKLGARIEDLPQGARLGTSSPRRAAVALSIRPDLKVEIFRGNVATRLKKMEEGLADATLLAAAGLERLGLSHLLMYAIDPAVMLPAAGQGAVGIEIRTDDARTAAIAALVNCAVTELRVTAERAYIRAMDGTCRTPLAAYMEVPDPTGRARFEVMSARPDGTELKRLSYLMEVKHLGDAERLGLHAGREMKGA
jgi:hydroxymethylbilane synthase